MKARLQTSLGQQLVLTPQLRQSLHLLQLSAHELEAELAEAVESNPLLDWAEPAPVSTEAAHGDEREAHATSDDVEAPPEWERGEEWPAPAHRANGGDADMDAAERVAASESLRDYLQWQLQLSQLSPRQLRIGLALVDAIDDDGYLRETPEAISTALAPDIVADSDEVLGVLHQLQRLDPPGVGARDLGECLTLQLQALPESTCSRALALQIAAGAIERLPKIGREGIARELQLPVEQIDEALHLLRSLDPRPGARVGDLAVDTYVTPDCTIRRRGGVWDVVLANQAWARIGIHQGYERMLQHAAGEDASYLRSRLQEARWLLKNLHARGETLLKVVRCVVRQQSGFLEFGPQALRPLTLRQVAAEIGVHESTVSRAISRKYAHTPRGTIPLRAFFASGVEAEGGGEASSTAIQAMIRQLVSAEDPRKPLSDARLADMLKAGGVPVARRTVAKYREALRIPSSHERVRLG
jgi:RNA polymerase sigma-54 factor